MEDENNIYVIGSNQIDKHSKYKNFYGDNELYWGLGIENELYLEFENKFKMTKGEFVHNKKKERYSVDYFSNYKNNFITSMLINYFEKNSVTNDIIDLPQILNSHSFTKTDIYNNSKTLYTKNQEPNLLFSGETLIEVLEKNDIYFLNSDKWLFDGDLIEFTTLNFYKTKLINVVLELEELKKEFINNLNNNFEQLNIFSSYGKIKFMEKNHPITTHLTNLNNVGIFNNGTLHFNLTLPTYVSNGQILDKKNFIATHKEAIKIIQWFEPIIIAIFGSADPFVELIESNEAYGSKSSQRCAISRYISIGTYDSDLMETGKIVTKKISQMDFTSNSFWWFNRFHENSVYTKLDEIGYDINFNKHWNHGIEIRIFDHIINPDDIYKCFEYIIYLCDRIYTNNFNIVNPIKNEIWNGLVYGCMRYGKEYVVNFEEKEMLESILGFKIVSESIENLFEETYLNLSKNKGEFSKLVL